MSNSSLDFLPGQCFKCSHILVVTISDRYSDHRYWMFYYLMRDSLVELPLGATSGYFGPTKKLKGFPGR